MPNRNYQNGKAKELRLTKKYKEAGADISQRSAGSHSPVDVWTIWKDKRIIKLSQVKPKSLSEKEKEKIQKELSVFDGIYMVITEVV